MVRIYSYIKEYRTAGAQLGLDSLGARQKFSNIDFYTTNFLSHEHS